MVTETVMVPVPLDRLQEVFTLLGSAPGTPKPTAATPVPAQAATPGAAADDEYTSESWGDIPLRTLYVQSNEQQRKCLDFLAAHSDEEVTSRQMADALKLDKGAKSLSGIFGGMGKRASSRHGESNLPWAQYGRFIDETDPAQGSETVFTMSKEVADILVDAKKRNRNRR